MALGIKGHHQNYMKSSLQFNRREHAIYFRPLAQTKRGKTKSTDEYNFSVLTIIEESCAHFIAGEMSWSTAPKLLKQNGNQLLCTILMMLFRVHIYFAPKIICDWCCGIEKKISCVCYINKYIYRERCVTEKFFGSENSCSQQCNFCTTIYVCISWNPFGYSCEVKHPTATQPIAKWVDIFAFFSDDPKKSSM